MPSLSVETMRDYLRRSISSMNQNKLNGLLAEIEFRDYLSQMGYGDNISVGGWIARSKGDGFYGDNTIAIFPQTIQPGVDYGPSHSLPEPPNGLHTICYHYHQIGIQSFFCVPVINENDDAESVTWQAVELGLPTQQQYEGFPDNITGFKARSRNYNFLRYDTTLVTAIPDAALPEEFTKENLRISFSSRFLSEIVDIDGVLWGKRFTYPLEIKEKTVGTDPGIGDFFGLDVGPFVKLAFYAAKSGNMHSLFIVKEIDNTTDRNLISWWYIPFERLAWYASWVASGGGTNMQGGSSTVVKISKNQFTELNRNALAAL